MKAFLLTLLHLTVMTATLCGPGPAPFLTTLPSARGGDADRRISSHVGGRTRWSDSGPDASHRHHPWQSAWLLGARWQVRSRRRDRAPWAGGGPDVGRGGCPETDANRGIIGCPSRIRCQAATGGWTKSRQWET